ncbi:hypothetical protein AGMMS49928_27120 [Spirochaetia bacterium]|nr:hypothetical protein AGMMS49928_27120 [Spirochaetia bacterium]
MKIGIITFHCGDNYGAVLQAFALFHKMQELFTSADVFIVDYRPIYIKKMFSLFRNRNIFYFINSILQLPFSLMIKYHFNHFRKKHYKYISIHNTGSLDFIVCGSDQIWNPLITKGLDDHYFGFFDGFSGKAVAYAASDGGNIEKDGDSNKIERYLNNLSAISVREKSMIPIIQKYHKNGIASIDPVFLPGVSFWTRNAQKQKFQNYILVYRVLPNDTILRDAEQIAKQTNKHIIEIRFGIPYKNLFSIKHTVLPVVSIPDFLSLFLYADFVLTNSFHGTAFSVIFNKQFCSYKINDSISSRITDLLSDIELTERYVECSVETITKKIDYQTVNEKIKQKCLSANSYILESLGKS